MDPTVLTVAAAVPAAVVGYYFLVGAGHAVAAFARYAGRVYGARHLGHGAAQPPPRQHAYRPYLLGQVWRDTGAVLRMTHRSTWRKVHRLHRRFWDWLDRLPLPVQFASVPLAAGLIVGTAAVAVPVAAGALALLAVPAAALVLWLLALLVVVGVLGAADLVLRMTRRVVVACPHPGCYHRIQLPLYACPACDARHLRLAPGRLGLLRHACECGASLPTLTVLGRHRLAGYCPRCRGPLPRRAGTVRTEHVPVIGGPGAGKTTFLCLAIDALDRKLRDHGGALEFPTPQEKADWREARSGLRNQVWLKKTQVALPTALGLDVRPRSAAGRLLYLFDAAGETYDAGGLLDAQRHLDHAKVALVVVDPLTIPAVWGSLTAAEQERIGGSGISTGPLPSDGAGELIGRLVGVLRTRKRWPRRKRARLRRVLVVVSKSDLLRETDVRGVGPDVRTWLEQEAGLGNAARTLEECCPSGQVRYLASGLDIDPPKLVEAVAWLVGVAPDGGPPRWYHRWIRRHRGAWGGTRRPGGRIPRGHAAGRLLMQAVAVPLAIIAGLAAPAALGWWLWQLW